METTTTFRPNAAPPSESNTLGEVFPDGFENIFSDTYENQGQDKTTEEPDATAERHESTSIDFGTDVNENVPSAANNLKDSVGASRVLAQDEIPQEMRERGIMDRYRSPDQPWSFYLKSVFWIHNETLNIWTALTAPVLILLMYGHYSNHLDFGSNTAANGLVVSVVSSVMAFLSFAAARTLRSKNVKVQNTVMNVHYAGVAIFIYGQMTMYFYSSGTASFYEALSSVFPILIFILSLCTFVSHVTARGIYPTFNERRKTVQLIPLGICVILGFLPIYFSRVHQCRKVGGFFSCITDGSVMIQFWVGVVLVPVALAVFYYHFPEKSNPGKRDVWGSSNHCGLTAATIGVLLGQYACFLDLTNDARLAFDIIQPDGRTIWITFTVFCTFLGTILCISLMQSVEPAKEKKKL